MPLLKRLPGFCCSCRAQSSNVLDPAALKTYSPNIEKPLIDKWTSQKIFTPSSTANDVPVYSIILPPPNITGTLHLGHALTISIADVICRWRRMRGQQVLWVPGTDHAGIATQVVVEKGLNSKNISRRHLGRENFVNEVWKWKKLKSRRIVQQLNRLGASLDWSREYFTLDENRSEAVTNSLIKLWNAGLVYRAESLVNWSCNLCSAISDIEVDHLSLDGPTRLSLPGYDNPITFGQLDHFAYRVENSEDEVIVATTRLETMLGDTAVAVHPNDNRFYRLHGKVVVHPLTNERIPIVVDESVDPSFGTGAVKVTPAHDASDLEISKRLGLVIKTVIADDGTMSENCGSFTGMKRFDVREALRCHLAELGVFRKTEPLKTSIPLCSRSGDVIEFLLKPQWFIKCDEMARRAIQAVEDGRLVIEPEKYHKMWFSWLGNIRDWCISRQLWWGHQTPFYRCSDGTKEIWVAAVNSADALVKSSKELNGKEILVERDEDVLDTWFSSALLPFSCFGWPNRTPDLEKYFPLSTMITGHDIVFFWVARMTMLSLELTGELPFKRVFLHSIMCDTHGRKMSKSLGNIIDPMDVIEGCSREVLDRKIMDNVKNGSTSQIESQIARTLNRTLFPEGIPECGADALRFTLLSQSVKNVYMNFNVDKCVSSKHFCNKIWQAWKFTRRWAEKLKIDEEQISSKVPPSVDDLVDVWILSKLTSTVNLVDSTINKCDFHLAASALRDFLYGDLCDVYIEAIKSKLNNGPKNEAETSYRILLHCFDVALRCLSPFMPFICESLYSSLPGRSFASIELASYPNNFTFQNENVLNQVEYALGVVRLIRKMKAAQGSLYLKNAVYILSDKHKQFEELKHLIDPLTRSDCVIAGKNNYHEEVAIGFFKEIMDANTEIYVQTGQANFNSKLMSPEQISKKRLKISSELQKLSSMTSADSYKIKVSDKVKLSHQQKMIQLEAELQRMGSSCD